MSQNSNRSAYTAFLIIVITAFILLLGRVTYLVVSSSDVRSRSYADPKVADSRVRGTIRDRNGNILAIQTTQYALYFRLDKGADLNRMAVIASPYVGMDAASILERTSNYKTIALIRRGIPRQTAEALRSVIEESGLEEAMTLEEYQGRSYPASFHAAQMLGFVNTDNEGLEGIEYSFDDLLYPYPELDKDITYGADIMLTLDLDIQYLLDVQVQRIADENAPDYIMGMVMDAKSGEILAAASYPWYDLNYYSLSSEDERMNRVLAYTYEPGSVFKIFTLAFAMDQGIDTDTHFLCDGEETFTVDGQRFTITCHEKHGEVDGKGMIEKSCNGAIAYWILQTDKNLFYDYLRSLGFGTRQDIGVTGSTTGTLRAPSYWSNRSQATLAFGQELSVNALQITSAATAIANDGLRATPSIIRQITDHEGNSIRENEPQHTQVISKENADKVLSYMVGAVENGTARRAAVDGVTVAAKTGTAEIINPVTGSYADGTSLASTIAFAPAEDPQYIVYLAVSAPRGDSIWGANVAAPSCGEIIRGLSAQGKIRNSNTSILQLN